MVNNKRSFHRFNPEDLIPPEWARGDLQFAYVFNPSIIRVSVDRLAMIYRLVLPMSEERKLCACQIDASSFQIIPESVTPFSDLIYFASAAQLTQRAQTWHADPRYFHLKGRLYVSWNDGSARPFNNQFLIEVDRDGLTPVGPARIIESARKRRNIEKNWIFFEAGNEAYCVYTTQPHDIMAVDLTFPDRVLCSPLYVSGAEVNYDKVYGEIRGGAQPIWDGDRFLCVAHSSFEMHDQSRYYACVAYEFLAKPPFNPVRIGRKPVVLPGGNTLSSFERPKLNPGVGGVIYPSGAVADGDDLIISYGINDEAAFIARIPKSSLLDSLEPAAAIFDINYTATIPKNLQGHKLAQPKLPLFWWDSRGKSIDKDIGYRKFRVGNFGDIASREIVERVGLRTTERVNALDGPKLLAVGSVLHNASDGDVVWGSGAKGTKRALDPSVKTLDVRAVRGPLTAEILQAHGIDLSKLTHVFDPGCLIADLWAQELDNYDVDRNTWSGDIRIVPHYRDDILMRRRYVNHADSIISVDDTPLGLAQKLLGAQAVLSSSLHGIIFAEALGIPAYWLKPLAGEDHFKYYDYYYGTCRYNVAPHDTVEDALKSNPQPLPKFEPQAYLDTFPHDRLDDLKNSGLVPGQTFTKDDFETDLLKRNVILSNTGQTRVKGANTSRNVIASLTLNLDKQRWRPAVLQLRLFYDAKKETPLNVDLRVNDLSAAQLMWHTNGSCEIEVALPLRLVGQQLDVQVLSDPYILAEKPIQIAEVSIAPLSDVDLAAFPKEFASASAEDTAYLPIRPVAVREAENEWTVDNSELAKLPSFWEFEERYIKLRDRSEIPILTDTLARSKMLFLTGPIAPLQQGKYTMAVQIGKQTIEADVEVQASGDQWTVKLIPDLQIDCDESEVTTLKFFISERSKDCETTRSATGLLLRKLAFAK